MALVTLAVGAVLAIGGVAKMRGAASAPKRTLEQIREDYVVAKEHVR